MTTTKAFLALSLVCYTIGSQIEKCPVGLGGSNCQLPLCGGRSREMRMPPDPAVGICICDEGWSGINCNVCDKDVSCIPLLQNSTQPICLTSGKVTPESMFKSCMIELPDFYKRLIGNRRAGLTVECRGYKPDNNSEGFGCDWQFWFESNQQFHCASTNCLPSVPDQNETIINCSKITCECASKDAELCDSEKLININPILAVVSGPAIFKCKQKPNGGSQCLLFERTLNDYFGQDGGMKMTCVSGTCIDRKAIPIPHMPNYTIAWMVLSILALPITIFFFILLRKMSQIKRAISTAPESDSSGSAILPEDEISLLYDHMPAKVLFADISYEYEPGKPVLQNISGNAEPGKVTAIIGGSGVGKTTLLHLLDGRLKPQNCNGENRIWVNSSPMSAEEMQKISGLVDQEDSLTSTLTVKECLMLSALLRLPPNMSSAAKRLRVEQCMKELGIDHLSDRVIGGIRSWKERGISSGERKRLSIAIALLTSPKILFLDEPTTGLDAFNAFRVMEAIIRMARQCNRTIILSIHQPRSNVFAMIDELILLGGSGKMLYSGDALGSGDYFQQLGFEIPKGFNTADYLVDITMDANIEYSQGMLGASNSISNLWHDSDEETEDHFKPLQRTSLFQGWFSKETARSSPPSDPELVKRIDYFEDEFIRSAIFERLKLRLPSDRSSFVSVTDLIASQNSSTCPRFTQLAIFSCRSWINLKRNPALLQAHYLFSILTALLTGTLFYHVTDDMAGAQNRLGCLFFILAYFAFSSLSSIDSITSEKIILRREKRDIDVSMFYLANVFFDLLPLRLVPLVLFGIVVYPLVGFYRDFWTFSKFILSLASFSWVASLFSLNMGVLIDSRPVALFFSLLGLLSSLLFAGFLLSPLHLNSLFRLLSHLSFFKYGYEALVVNEFSHIIIRDSLGGLARVDVPGEIILRQFGFKSGTFIRDLAVLGVMGVGLLFIGLLGLRRSTNY